jgi:hypothetical protein
VRALRGDHEQVLHLNRGARPNREFVPSFLGPYRHRETSCHNPSGPSLRVPDSSTGIHAPDSTVRWQRHPCRPSIKRTPQSCFICSHHTIGTAGRGSLLVSLRVIAAMTPSHESMVIGDDAKLGKSSPEVPSHRRREHATSRGKPPHSSEVRCGNDAVECLCR